MFYILKSTYLYRSRRYFFLNNIFFFKRKFLVHFKQTVQKLREVVNATSPKITIICESLKKFELILRNILKKLLHVDRSSVKMVERIQ